jgi:hypothetical protein
MNTSTLSSLITLLALYIYHIIVGCLKWVEFDDIIQSNYGSGQFENMTGEFFASCDLVEKSWNRASTRERKLSEDLISESVHSYNRHHTSSPQHIRFQMPKMSTSLLLVVVIVVILPVLQRSKANCGPNSTRDLNIFDFPLGFVFGTASAVVQVKNIFFNSTLQYNCHSEALLNTMLLSITDM